MRNYKSSFQTLLLNCFKAEFVCRVIFWNKFVGFCKPLFELFLLCEQRSTTFITENTSNRDRGTWIFARQYEPYTRYVYTQDASNIRSVLTSYELCIIFLNWDRKYAVFNRLKKFNYKLLLKHQFYYFFKGDYMLDCNAKVPGSIPGLG